MSTEYTPFALKYRPRRLEDLLGQDVLVKTLMNAILSNKVHHAFLFYGPLGCGKTSAARCLAASLNCDRGESTKPCGKCPNCESIMLGQCVDVVEMDAASQRGIDDIREIKREAAYQPVNSRYKIFIIDEAHALSGAAAEAMLKILEEPPQSVKFILCTTDRHKLKTTILSRCQDFKIQLLPWGLIAAHLKDICGKEIVTIDDDALKLISKVAGGHMRNALQGLDKVVAFAGHENITRDVASKALGAVDETVYFDLVDSIIEKRFSDGMRIIQKALLTGQSVGTILDGLMNHLRTLLIIRICDNTSGLIHLGEEDKKRYLHQAQLTHPDLLDNMITHLVNIHRGIFYNTSPQVLFEQFLLKSIKSNHELQRLASAAK